MEKLSSMKLVPGAKTVGDRFIKEYCNFLHFEKSGFSQPFTDTNSKPRKSRQLRWDMTCLGLVIYWDTCQLQLEPSELNQDRLNYWLAIFKSERKAHRGILYPYPEKKMWSCFWTKISSLLWLMRHAVNWQAQPAPNTAVQCAPSNSQPSGVQQRSQIKQSQD